MAGSDVRQLLLQVDASVAVAQRNLQSLARSVANDASAMDTALGRVDKAFTRVSKSAEESAQAFIEGDRAAKSLIASIDPLFAAQQRYDRELEKANSLYKTGALSAAEFAKVQAGLKANLDQSHAAFGRVATTSGSMRAGLQQLSFQVGDVAQGFALGVKPMTIFAQQGGQIIQTFQLMAGAGNKFLSFLGGPWGLAISAAASILLLLSSRTKETGESVGDLVEKMRKQADQARANEQANIIWANSLEGVREAQKKLREEIEKSIISEGVKNQQNLDSTRKQLADQKKQLAQAEAAQRRAEQELARARSSPGIVTPGSTGPTNDASLAAASRKLEEAKKRVNDLKAAVQDSEKTLRSVAIPVARDYGAATANLSIAVGSFYANVRSGIEVLAQNNQALNASLGSVEEAIAKAEQASSSAASAGVNVNATTKKVQSLTQALLQGKIGPDAYAKSVREMARSLDAAAKAAEAAKKKTSGEFGKQISFDDARNIAEGAGFKVNSAYRSTARQAALYNDPSVNRPGNPVARPGTSAHEGVNGKWALDIQFAPGLTADKIRKVYGDQGVKLSAIYKEKGHFHIEGSRSQAAAQERAQEVAEAKQVRNDNGFEEKLDQLDNQLLAAKLELVEDTHAQAEFASELAKAEGERVKVAIQNDVEEGKLTQAQADILKAKQDEITVQRQKNVAIREQVQSLRDQDQNEQQAYDFKIEALRYQDEIARTAASHRTIQLEILDLVYEEKKKHLEYLKAQADLVGNTQEAARLQAEINNLPAQQARDTDRVNRGTQGPLEQYFDGVPKNAEETNEAMQRLAVQGIDGAIDSIIALTDGFESFRDTAISAIKAVIAELIRMQLMKAAMNIIGAATGAPTGGFGGGGDVGGAMLGSFMSGGDPFTGAMGLSGGIIPGFASGGAFEIKGRGGIDQNILSINGNPVARVGHGEIGMILPKMPKVGVPQTSRGGDQINHINVMAPNTGNPRQDRATARHQANLVREAVAKASKAAA